MNQIDHSARSQIKDRIKGGLVVSCQAFPGDPLEDTETIRRIARAAVAGGAVGLRLNGSEHIAAIRRDTDLPIIGIQKKYDSDGNLRITPDFASAVELAQAGASMIALDCTGQPWPGGDPWQQCVERIHRELNLPVMADIATLEEALAAAGAGADMIGTTLNGCTEETRGSHGFDWDLLASLVRETGRPIIAEGRISTPAEARRAIRAGAWSVVVGSAITRPGIITAGFVQTMTSGPCSESWISSPNGVAIGDAYIKAGPVDREDCVTHIHDRESVAAGIAPFLELSHVSVARGANVVLHDINLTINAGEHIAILGPNGCGKSTLIKTITCECYPLVPLEGEPETKVEIFGRNRWDLTELKKRLGVVSPELPGRQTLTTTGRDAVLTGFFSSSTLWPNLNVTDAMRARAEQVLHQIDAVTLADKPVGEMSAGQQRRIMIGRALVASSRMLLLDEPSNALDLAAQVELRNLLRNLAQQGTGILLITHHIADILPEIDRILMMREGRIVADGPKSTLLTAPRLSDLFNTKVDITERDGFNHAW